jgi:pyridoxine 5-phosphate synthase
MPKLGVNIDHVATLRQARLGRCPDPLYAAILSERAGASSIVAHLRQDRRHIQDADIKRLCGRFRTKFNLEMSLAAQILKIACKIKPFQVTLVPEKREELTTEGGLDVVANFKKVCQALSMFKRNGIRVSLFIDPDKDQIDAASSAGAKIIELHTGRYAGSVNIRQKNKYFNQIKDAVIYAKQKGLIVNAGHGLDYANVKRIASIKGVNELNIGYSIIAKALYVGLYAAVKEMRQLSK